MENDENAIKYAPTSWKKFIEGGLPAVKTIEAPRVVDYPGKKSMLPSNEEEWKVLKDIHERYGKNDPSGFERLSAMLLSMISENYGMPKVTRPTKDGGRDAIGTYSIKTPNNTIFVEYAMESKCYDPNGHGVGVKETSWLISRIRNRQFGVMVTTSYINQQAYLEIIEDQHPILFITGKDIVSILREKENVTSKNINEWLDKIIELTS